VSHHSQTITALFAPLGSKRCSECVSIGSTRSWTRTAYANGCVTRCYDIRSFSARSRPSLILSKTNIDLCASRIKTAMTLVSSDYAQLLLVAKQFHDEIFCCLAISTQIQLMSTPTND
jgi:hypothetical protein